MNDASVTIRPPILIPAQRVSQISAETDVFAKTIAFPGVVSQEPRELAELIRAHDRFIRAFQMCHGTQGLSLHDAAIRMREDNRLVGRPLPRRAIE